MPANTEIFKSINDVSKKINDNVQRLNDYLDELHLNNRQEIIDTQGALFEIDATLDERLADIENALCELTEEEGE